MLKVLLRIEILLSQILKLSEWKIDTKTQLNDEIWLDSAAVKRLLQIGDMTLFRRRNEGVFKSKKIGKKWFYAKSTLS
jgi:hypothetical protein